MSGLDKATDQDLSLDICLFIPLYFFASGIPWGFSILGF